MKFKRAMKNTLRHMLALTALLVAFFGVSAIIIGFGSIFTGDLPVDTGLITAVGGLGATFAGLFTLHLEMGLK